MYRVCKPCCSCLRTPVNSMYVPVSRIAIPFLFGWIISASHCTFSYFLEPQQSIGNWNVSSVTTMESMFEDANAFDQDLSQWDVGRVVTFAEMFQLAPNFNRPLGTWNVSSATSMTAMFDGANAFDQDISDWVRTIYILVEQLSTCWPCGLIMSAFLDMLTNRLPTLLHRMYQASCRLVPCFKTLWHSTYVTAKKPTPWGVWNKGSTKHAYNTHT